MKILLVEIDETFDRMKFNILKNYVNPETVNKIKNFANYEDSLRTLLGELAIRMYLIKETQLANNDIEFSKNDYGKPYLSKDIGIYFNISHSGRFVACAIDNSEIGIDIEEVKKIDLDIALRFFSNIEWKDLCKLDEKDRLSYFFDLWTLKECYIKALGIGLYKKLNSFSIVKESNQFKIMENMRILAWNLYRIQLDDKHKISICTMTAQSDIQIEHVLLDDIFVFFKNLNWKSNFRLN